MESKHTSRNLDKAYLPTLLNVYLFERFDLERRYPSKTKLQALKLLVFIGLGIWSLTNMTKFVLEYLEYLDTDEGDRSLRENSSYGGSWFPWS